MEVNNQTIEEVIRLAQQLKEKQENYISKADLTAVQEQMKADLDAAHEARIKAEMEKLSGTIEEIVAKLNRLPNATGGEGKDEREELAVKAINKVLRKQSLTPEEAKALSLDDDPAGGYLRLPETYAQQVIAYETESSNVLGVADVEDINSDTYISTRETSSATYGWTGSERDTASETDTPALAQDRGTLREVYVYPKITQRDLDFGFNIVPWLTKRAQEGLTRGMNAGFISGAGNAEPEGVMSNSDVATINSGAASSIPNLDVIRKMTLDTDNNGLLEPFRANATFMMRSSTLLTLLVMKDGNGKWILPVPTQRNAFTLFGYPVLLSPDMDTVGAGNKAIVLGDFRQGYKVIRSKGIRVKRYDDSSSHPWVKFFIAQYVDGYVKNPQAFVTLTIAA